MSLPKKAFSIISLGCPRNLVDSESIIFEFKDKGYIFQEEPAGADTLIINTCAFIEDAKKESIDTILKAIDAKKSGLLKKVIVAGCLPQRYPTELKKELKDVDEFRGIVSKFRKRETQRLTPRHYAYVKISEGCSNRCAYCVIPGIKGPYRPRAMDSVIEEAKFFVKKGAREIILVGQDTALYKKLPELLKRLSGICGRNWVRLLYCHPANLGKDVINVIRDSPNICKYIDLPIEHISGRVLKKMRRRTTRDGIVSLIEYIRKQMPGAAIRTSLIVGFPGETEKEFIELLSFMRQIKFERLGIFRYSREEGTPAYKFRNQVPEEEKERRFSEAMLLQQEISRDVNERFKGRTLKVLVGEQEGYYYIARTEYDAPEVDGSVYVSGKDLKVGNFYNVRITDTREYDLTGEAVQT